MGRSNSCLKIITCGSDSADQDDLQLSESKGSSDKRVWSFRKRSARHRVLSNTVISETPFSINKESPETASLNFQPSDNSAVPEKISVVQCVDEKPQLSIQVNSKVSETVADTTNESEVDFDLEESVVIAIQAAIRGFLARRELTKIRNVVKLQAAVRGHLVRRHAVGTLRCVQAIVKMQTLIRARRARLSLEGSCTEKKLDGKHEKDNCSSMTLKENSVTKPTVTYTSIDKLLSNRFARQMMESTPRTKPIHVKCDPSKPNSAWSWLERWMSVSSAEQTPKPELMAEQPESEKSRSFASQLETKIPLEVFEMADTKSSIGETVVLTEREENRIAYEADDFKFQASCPTSSVRDDSKSSIGETVMPTEREENLIAYEVDEFKFQASCPTSSVRDDLELPQPENTSTSDTKETLVEINPLLNQTMPDANSPMEPNSLPREPEIESEPPKRSMKRFASEQLETEGKKLSFGSRKASNPAFIAAQSKFEELSSPSNSERPIISSCQDVGVESNTDEVSSGADTVTNTKDFSTAVPHNLKVQYVGSECGTELSITSTLDSPDRSEVEATEYEHEAKVSEEEICNPNSTGNPNVEAKDASNLSHAILDQPEKLEDAKVESLNSVVTVDSPQIEQKPERSASDLQRVQDSETGRQAYRSSPEASPRSLITVPESQGTPSSEVSVKARKKKTDKSVSNQKRKSLSASKGSPNQDSGARSSMEQLPRDQKNGKRRNSFGSPRTDHVDQEPRDSSSSNSLPHFMQATESARAKVQANTSPRSSPDVQERDIYIKKRHSLPGANGRQDSPRIQRSMSQAQQGAKGNGAPPLHERKWQR